MSDAKQGSQTMVWQSYENQGVANIDQSMAEELKTYLENKEALLGEQVIGAVHLDRNVNTALEGGVRQLLRINDAVEELGKKIHLLLQMKEPKALSPDWKTAVKHINEILWNYIDVLEGCSIELFQQIDQVGFEQWDLQMSREVTAIKDELAHRMDDLMWAFRRLNQQMKVYRKIFVSHQSGWQKVKNAIFFWRSPLDKEVESTIHKCHKFLNFRYGKFIERYTGCAQLYEAAERSLRQYRSYKSLAVRDVEMLDRFEQLYQLLTLWELNRSAKAVPQLETIRALRRLTTKDKALALFQGYLKAICIALFDQSRILKKQFSLDSEGQIQRDLFEVVAGFRSELKMLKETMLKYHKFMINTDPAFYSAFSIYRWLRGKKSKSIQQLDVLLHESDRLDAMCAELLVSLESDQLMERRLTTQVENEVDHYLHEMKQPLASREYMRRYAKLLLNRLHSLDEMGAFHNDVVDYICKALCRAMLADWKYHVLQEIPLFHRIYEIHHHIIGESEDRGHLNRLHRFTLLIERLEQWISARASVTHAHDIELDINDIKVYLQDFLAQVQRLEQTEDPQQKAILEQELSKARQSLIEYLYLFGKFFHKLHPDNPEQWLIRKQLLFVDQYFEAIDSKLQDLIVASWK